MQACKGAATTRGTRTKELSDRSRLPRRQNCRVSHPPSLSLAAAPLPPLPLAAVAAPPRTFLEDFAPLFAYIDPFIHLLHLRPRTWRNGSNPALGPPQIPAMDSALLIASIALFIQVGLRAVLRLLPIPAFCSSVSRCHSFRSSAPLIRPLSPPLLRSAKFPVSPEFSLLSFAPPFIVSSLFSLPHLHSLFSPAFPFHSSAPPSLPLFSPFLLRFVFSNVPFIPRRPSCPSFTPVN